MFDSLNVKLGIAPIGWTNDDMPDLGSENTFEQCVSEMALAGFQGTEIGNKYPKDPAALKKALELRGIQVCNAWFSMFLTTKAYEDTEAAFLEHIRFLKEMGANVVGVSEQGHSIQGQLHTPVFEQKHKMDEVEWYLLVEGLNRLGRKAKEMGITLTYHHHMGTVIQTEEEIDRLMAETDPDAVGLLFDTGHLAYCEIDPVSVVEKHGSRIGHVHLKDIRRERIDRNWKGHGSFLEGVRAGTFTVPGDGDLDFTPIFAALERCGYEGWMVVEAEQDPAVANPLEYAMKGRAYIREKTGL